MWTYARPDDLSELGALKVFQIKRGALPLPPLPDEPEYEEVQRLKNEIEVLNQNRPGLPTLLAENVRNYWIVTELFPEGSLEKHPLKYRGNAAAALRAFRSLVVTVASIHKEGYVHRDIKPANVFVRAEDELILGDFGIVYLPNQSERVTTTNERVGPRDYMPPWADIGERLSAVEPNFDVYMLGKLLWCMVSGRLKLPREYHREKEFDLTSMFPNDEKMGFVNSILDKSVVEQPAACLESAKDLLEVVDESITNLERGPMLDHEGKFRRPCRICGKGFYRPLPQPVIAQQSDHHALSQIRFRLYICTVCAHYEFFAPGFPEEAAQRQWKATV
jgi:serine/threonine protein kinase